MPSCLTDWRLNRCLICIRFLAAVRTFLRSPGSVISLSAALRPSAVSTSCAVTHRGGHPTRLVDPSISGFVLWFSLSSWFSSCSPLSSASSPSSPVSIASSAITSLARAASPLERARISSPPWSISIEVIRSHGLWPISPKTPLSLTSPIASWWSPSSCPLSLITPWPSVITKSPSKFLVLPCPVLETSPLGIAPEKAELIGWLLITISRAAPPPSSISSSNPLTKSLASSLLSA